MKSNLSVRAIIAGVESNIDHFNELYEKYKKDKSLILDKKNKEVLELSEDKLSLMSHYENHSEKLKSFDSFLNDLLSSLNRDEKRLEKLEKSFKNSKEI